MYHLHLARNLRSLVFILITTSIIAGIGIIWWANSTGLPESWRVKIEEEISKHDTHVKIGSLSYHPLRGVVAKKVRVFASPKREREISYVESVILDFDNTKLARGKIHLSKLVLIDANLALPVDPDDPNSETLNINNANGTFFLPGKNRIEARNATGNISGINVTLNARYTGKTKTYTGTGTGTKSPQNRELIARIINELKKWKFDPATPPQLDILIEHNTNDPSQSIAKLNLQTDQIAKNLHELEYINATAEIRDNLLTVTSLDARDSRGSLTGRIDYDLNKQSGRFELESSLEIPPLLQAWFGLPPIRDALIAGKQQITTQGEFKLIPDKAPDIRMTGRAVCESVMLKGLQFDSASTSFAWNNGDLFLRDIELNRVDGKAKGKAMIQWPIVRLSLDSTLPISTYRPLYADKPLEKTIVNFGEKADSHNHITMEGGFDLTDRKSWAYTGTGTIINSSYKGVSINRADCKFSVSYHKLEFYDGAVDFDYTDYPLRKSFEGKTSGTAKVPRIYYDRATKAVHIEKVSGTMWPAPMVRLFAPNLADSLEKYKFHQPPTLTGSGVVFVNEADKTKLNINFESESKADYNLLGSDVTLEKPTAEISIEDGIVTIKDLKANLFNGPVVTNLVINKDEAIDCEVQWTKLSVKDLAETYGHSMKGGGVITGRIEFEMTANQIETMNGEGLIAIEKTELFSVPMFGPLSPVISGVLGDRRAGFERAKSAFCNFDIEEGILSTDNFTTATSSIVFAGDGSVDLKNKTIDMTMRLNARGLLGILTLPLRPFYGMFQFRGTGPLNDTKWENVMFTAPSDSQKKILLNPPKAKVVDSPE